MKRRRTRRDERAREARSDLAPQPGGGAPFDAAFFLGQLAGFVRDRCPPPEAGLPKVELHVADGDVLDLCHVIGVARDWVALAVKEPTGSGAQPRMRTELVPFGSLVRVTIRAAGESAEPVGFDLRRAPAVLAASTPATPETTLRAAARAVHEHFGKS